MKILLNKKIYNVSLFQLFIFLIILIFNSCFSVIQASVLEKGVNIAIGSNHDNLISCISLYIVLTIVYSIFIYLQGIFSSKLGRRVVCDLQNKTYEKVVKIPIEKSEKYSEGDYLTLIIDDSENTSAYLFQGIIPITSEIIRIMVGFFYLLKTSMLIASIFAILTIILLLITRYYSNKVRKTSSSLQIIEGENRNFLFEHKQNQEIIRVFNAFETRNIIFEKLFNHKYEKKITNALDAGKLNCFSNLIINFSTIFIVFIGFYLSTLNLISIGSLVGIYTIIGESILYPLLRLPDKLIENSKRKASLIRINNFLNLEHELEHEISIISKSVLNNVKKTENYLFKIIGNKVSFSYDKTNFILTECNFELSLGEIVSLVGESGSGKTTLISLILSLRNYDNGELYLDIHDKHEEITKLKGNSLRDYFSYAPQENTLLPGFTLKENLMLGNLSISTVDIVKLCKQLNLHDKIQTLELQYDTIIDENIQFSIGQLQRLSIARAILSNKPFIILDEPFSALDKKNIENLQIILKELSKTTGILIVSHQEASLEISDRIYFMNGGGLYEKQ